jgi:hypothetical protein
VTIASHNHKYKQQRVPRKQAKMSSATPLTPQPTKGLPKRTRSQGLQNAASRSPFHRMGTADSVTGSTHVARARARTNVKLDEVLANDSGHSGRHEPQPAMLLKMPSQSNHSSIAAPVMKISSHPKGRRVPSSQTSKRSLQSKGSLRSLHSSFQSKSSVLEWEDSVNVCDMDGSANSFSYEIGEEDPGVHQRRDESPPRDGSRRTLEEFVCQAEEQLGEDDGNYEMELSPGYYVPFRGAKEVWKAVAVNNTLACTCFECGIELVSVPDCEHVVCPDCRMVNPVFDHPAGVTNPFGAGIGLKKEWVTAKLRNQSRRR